MGALLENPFKTNWREGLSCSPSQLFSTASDPREWTLIVFSGRQPQLITPENEGGDETSSPSPPRFNFFDDPDIPLGGPPEPHPVPPGPPDPPGLPPRWPPSLWPPAPPPAGEGERVRTGNSSRERSRPRSPLPEPQLIPVPMSDGDDGQPPQDGRQRQRSRSRDRAHAHAQAPQEPQVQHMVIQEPVAEPDEDPAVANPSLPLAGPSPSAEQRGLSRRQQRSRSRERTPPHTSPHAGQQPQPVAPPPGEQQIHPQTIQGTDEESATVEPQSRVSDHSRLPKSKESRQKQMGKKTMAEVKKPSYLPKAKKHKLMDSDEEDEEPQNELGTSSNSQPMKPVLPLHQGPAASSQGPAASANSEDEDSEYSDDYSARSQDSGRTVLYPDLYVLTNDEHWTVTPETHKYASAAGSFCFVTTENGEQQDVCNLTTMPCVQRSLCFDEVTNDSGSTQVEVP